MIESTLQRVVEVHTLREELEEEWNLQAIIDYVNANRS